MDRKLEWVAAIAALVLVLGAGACQSSGVRNTCLELAASEQLNLYDGQPHTTVVYLYPLQSRLGFEQMSVIDLLAGESPAGLVGSRLAVTVAPGETRDVEETLPARTSLIGLVADFYRAPGESEGARKAIVEARCGFRAPRLVLSSRELSVD